MRRRLLLLCLLILPAAACGSTAASRPSPTPTPRPSPTLTRDPAMYAYSQKVAPLILLFSGDLDGAYSCLKGDQLSCPSLEYLPGLADDTATKLRAITPPPAVQAGQDALVAALAAMRDVFKGVNSGRLPTLAQTRAAAEQYLAAMRQIAAVCRDCDAQDAIDRWTTTFGSGSSSPPSASP